MLALTDGSEVGLLSYDILPSVPQTMGSPFRAGPLDMVSINKTTSDF